MESFLNVTDSIKIFSFSSNPYETVKFKLSKNYGLIEFLPFNEFIYHYQYSDLEPQFKIIGFETPAQKKGYSKPNFENYFHLKQGDKLFWRNYSKPDNLILPETISYDVDSITYSYLSSDSVYYEFSRKNYNKYGVLQYIGNYSENYTKKNTWKFH